MKPAVMHLIVRHDAWCPMAYGESAKCCCKPVPELVDEATFASTVQRDFRNRAHRRAEARRELRNGRAR